MLSHCHLMIDVLLSMTHKKLKSLIKLRKNDVKITIIPHFAYDFAIFIVILHPVNRYEPAKSCNISAF